MSDFDLSQALEGSPDSNEMGFESRCFDTTSEIFRLDDGLDLMVSHNPKTMQSVALLLLAVKRMKKSPSDCGETLSDEQLCCQILESLVEETIVQTEANSTTGPARTFLRTDSFRQCSLCDFDKKDVIRVPGELNLKAITLKGGHQDCKVNFTLSRYITTPVSPSESQALILSITNNLHISCSMKGGQAVLNLEKCSQQDLCRISVNGSMDRFLFYKRVEGKSVFRFESVKCRGWFISTSAAENQLVEMCKVDTAWRCTSFSVHENKRGRMNI